MSQRTSQRAKQRTGQAANRSEAEPQREDVSLPAVFAVLAACHTLAALYAPIQDCDEVFNYWEPTHFLTHGKGFQTWEYAPKYAIRSWAYTGLHAAAITVLQTLAPSLPKTALFYGLRIFLGLACAACETRFFSAVSRTLNERVAILCLLVTVTSPGLYHASVAYLPSSFAMYTAMLGAAAFMDWRSGLKTAQGIFWFGVGASLGWPFAIALSVPFLVEELSLAVLSDASARVQFVKRVAVGTACAALALGAQVVVDASFYNRLTIVPLNIVLYNVFSSRGPDLYGTEPWHFYLRNLALNFHVWLVLALLAYPILLLQMACDRSWKRSRALVFLAPSYLWLAIFTIQPHKEERFVYPAYPFLVLNAAYTFNAALAFLGDRATIAARVPVTMRLAGILTFVGTILLLTAAKVSGTWTAFSSPLSIYEPLAGAAKGGNVCLGKEWYRFPSHYLLPDGFQARFIRSEFHGLLPGEFDTNSGSLFTATSADPGGMNDENLEDLGKYTDLELCSYLVDSHMPSTITTVLEPGYIGDNKQWKVLKCSTFLDSSSTPIIPRLIWLPDFPWLPARLKRIYGQYCLLERQNNSTLP